MTPKERALRLAEAASDAKGLDIRVLDLRELTSFTSFFVIVSATSDRHARALASAAEEAAREVGDRPLGTEGEERGRWVLVDFGDVVFHVFQEDAREFYSLERLWSEAEDLELPEAVAALP